MSQTSEKPHVERGVSIIVNTKTFKVKEKEVTFEEVVEFAFGSAPGGENISFTVTYRKGHGSKPTGSLIEGESVKVKDGMVFNVTKTDKS